MHGNLSLLHVNVSDEVVAGRNQRTVFQFKQDVDGLVVNGLYGTNHILRLSIHDAKAH